MVIVEAEQTAISHLLKESKRSPFYILTGYFMELSKLQTDWLGRVSKVGYLVYSSEDYGFSWKPCECCGSPLGGDRFRAVKCSTYTDDMSDYSVCIDCIAFIANGDLPADEHLD
jgi:hypothetical protein